MAETKITNIIQPEIYTPYVMERSIYLNKFFQSGVMVMNPAISDKLAQGNTIFNIPYWNDITHDSEIPKEAEAVTAQNITADKILGRKQWRITKVGSNDMAAQLAGEDPMRAIGDRMAGWWSRVYQANIVAYTVGIITDNVDNDSSDLINDISIEDGNNATSANKISSDAVIDTVTLFGDHGQEIGAIAMHSVPYYRLVKLNLIDFTKESAQNIGFGTYMGLTVIVDDNIYTAEGSTSGTKYWTILYKPGTLQWGETTANYVPTEIERDESTGGGRDYLHERRVFCVAATGFTWVEGSVSGEFPVNTELVLAANHDRKYNKKNCGISVLITNG
jgi:hypothetical protein